MVLAKTTQGRSATSFYLASTHFSLGLYDGTNPHSVLVMPLSRARTSLRADSPSRNAPACHGAPKPVDGRTTQ